MRPNPAYAVEDPGVVRRLIEENPWATIVSQGERGLVASHYPVLIDPQSTDLAVLTHVGRPDEQLHRFGSSEVLLIVAGPHGYISPSWYVPGSTPAPTWNFSVAHCYGVPEILEADENLRVLTRLVEHFERHVEEPLMLDQKIGAQIAQGTVGLRLPIERFTCKVKMSQDKDPVSRKQVLAALQGEGPYADPALAGEMARALGALAGES
jgi:transcriptional regulator